MTIIKAVDFISSGFSADDADKLTPSIDEANRTGMPFTVDFSGVKHFKRCFLARH